MLTAARFFVTVTLLATASFAARQTISDIGGLKLREGEISASEACKVATKFADGLGLGKFAIERYTAFLQNVRGISRNDNKSPREWVLVYPNSKRGWIFRVDSISGKLQGYEDPAISHQSADSNMYSVGLYAATRTKFAEHIRDLANRVGIYEPIMSTQTIRFGHDGRLKVGRPYTMEVNYIRHGYRYELTLDPPTGRLAKLIVYPSTKPSELILGQFANRADYSKAKDAAIAFAKQLGMPSLDQNDFISNFDDDYRKQGPAWILEHPNGIFEIDALKNSVKGFYSRLITERFDEGDKAVTTDPDEMKKIIEIYGKKFAIAPEAVLRVSMSGFQIGRGVQLPHIVGEYRVGRTVVARIVCDPYRGELEHIALAPEGLLPAMGS